MSQDGHWHMWVAGDQGLEAFRYDDGLSPASSHVQAIVDQIISDSIRSTIFFIDHAQKLWIVSDRDMMRYDQVTGVLHSPITDQGFSNYPVNDIDIAPDSSI